MYRKGGKRVFDAVAASLGLLILALPLGIIALLVRLASGSPVLFRQERVGKAGRIFHLLKFRTMRVRAQPDSPVTVCGDERITPLGRLLRRHKLDEWPQLWNVLVGEMSLVGPRPDVPGYGDKLEGEARRLLSLRPGLTGPASLAYRNEEEILAQVDDPVRYNNEVIYPHKVRLNLVYLEECSLSRDLYYLVKTILPLPSRQGKLLRGRVL